MGKRKKVLTVVAGVIGTILLGAIGSGLWERCLSPVADWTIKVVVSGMSLLSSTYKNGIYQEVAKGHHEYSALFLHSLVLAMLPIGYLLLMYRLLMYRHPQAKQDEINAKIRTFVRGRGGYYALTILTFAVIINFFFDFTKTTYINDVATTSRQSISILAPHISDSEVKELWAMFHSMTGEKDFAAFKSKLENLSRDKGIKIPEFPGLWIRPPNKSDPGDVQ